LEKALEERNTTFKQLKEQHNELTTTLTQLAQTQDQLLIITKEKEDIIQQMKDTLNKLSETQCMCFFFFFI
jgi:sugar-specific transcriptional regulator TrmB